MNQYEKHVFDAIYARRSIRVYLDKKVEHEKNHPRAKYIEEAVYWQKYDPARKHEPRPGNLIYGNT